MLPSTWEHLFSEFFLLVYYSDLGEHILSAFKKVASKINLMRSCTPEDLLYFYAIKVDRPIAEYNVLDWKLFSSKF